MAARGVCRRSRFVRHSLSSTVAQAKWCFSVAKLDAPEPGLILQQTEFLGPNAVWSNTTNLLSINGPPHVVHQTVELSHRFYRLQYP